LCGESFHKLTQIFVDFHYVAELLWTEKEFNYRTRRWAVAYRLTNPVAFFVILDEVTKI
jgi:hypothetical protein